MVYKQPNPERSAVQPIESKFSGRQEWETNDRSQAESGDDFCAGMKRDLALADKGFGSFR